ncbi:phosphotransferase [Aquicoccus sp. SU-CL01552]|uniref:aminoglycoside phosphotransferase family protein n=1 Tax=Aquicoccus sp. SU-CL01552 TaxID=3127656 RepID=UPI0031096E74
MTDRSTLADSFLATTDWAQATRAPLAGDASNRRYERLTDPVTGQSAVLMDAPPDKGEDVRPFTAIAQYLRDQGLSAPQIHAEDAETGFLLLEDLGDALFARVLEADPAPERQLYEAATQVLVTLFDAPLPDLAPYAPPLMAELSALAFRKYRMGITGDDGGAALTRFLPRFEDILRKTTGGRQVVALRDYHAENLIWLPERAGPARVGLLDFQDAMLGHPAYDLVSLLQDVRREVPAGIELAMTELYVSATGLDDHAFRTAYAVLGAQRALRILGVFARLATDYGKPHYVDLIPAVWAHLLRDLEHPALAPVAELLLEALPAPTPEALAKLRPQ